MDVLRRIVLDGVRRWPEGPVSSLVIEDGRIKEWAADRRPGAELEFDGSLAVPGLVDVHAHLDKAGLAERFVNVTGTIGEARTRMRDAKSSITRDDVARRAEGVLRALIVNGATAVRSHVDIDPLIGLRGVEALLELRERYSGSIDIQLVAFPQEGAAGQPITGELMREALEMGVDVVGGHLSVAPTPELMERELDVVFSLAAKYDRPIDVHTDFGIDFEPLRTRHADGRYYPDGLGAVHLAERTIQEGLEGRVTASHLCGLDSIPPEERSNVIDLLARAQVSVVALPSSNLYAHGRTDTAGARRGIAPIRELLRGGVHVAVGTDNIRDTFNPYVGPDLIANCILTAITCQWVTTDDFVTVVGLHTDAAATIMGLPEYGLEPGCQADIAILEPRSVEELLDGSGLVVAVLKGRNTRCPLGAHADLHTRDRTLVSTVDLRSDTVTRPTPQMRAAMAAAEVGDDVLGEDPTVRELEDGAAALLGKEAGLFVASGTMANQLAAMTLCDRGAEVVVPETSHVYNLEVAGLAALQGLQPRPVPSVRGCIDEQLLASAIRAPSLQVASTGLVLLESSADLNRGWAVSPASLAAMADVARARGVPVYLDGARIFNSAVALGLPPRDLAESVDAMMFCLSKGLGCPVGSLLVGETGFIAAARPHRQRLGGGWRQAGILAAAGLVALSTMIDRLSDDHERARRLARGMSELGFGTDPSLVDTNIVNVEMSAGRSATAFAELMGREHVRVKVISDTAVRMVTHLDVQDGDIDRAIDVAASIVR